LHEGRRDDVAGFLAVRIFRERASWFGFALEGLGTLLIV